jgi:hypothetical protein
MREQKIVITDSESTINEWLNGDGWEIVNIISQQVSTSAGYIRGNFCFLLERDAE